MTVRSLLLLSLAGLVLVGAARAQEPGSKPKEFRLSYALRVPRIDPQLDPERFSEVLSQILDTPEVTSAFAAVFPPKNKPDRDELSFERNWAIVAPGRQAIVHLAWTFLCDPKLALPPDVSAAVAKAITQKLEALLYQPQLEDLTQGMHLSLKQAQDAEAGYAKVAERLLALGYDDFAAAQQALSGLMQKSLENEVELRTEHAMQELLPRQIAQQEASLREQEQRLAEAEARLQDARAQLAVLHAARAKEGDSGIDAPLREAGSKERSLREKQEACIQQVEHHRGALAELQNQHRQSLFALQRATSRKDVLDRLVAEQRDRLAKATALAREREAMQREAERLRKEADDAHARARALRAERDALETVRVEPW